MSLILKIDGDPVWLPPQSHSYSGTVILLQGDDVHGQPVDVPADLLLAVSPLLRSILSAGHLPPAYYQPAISLPSVTYQVLQIVKELFSSGMVSIDKRTKVTEIQSVFKMLGIGVELICDQPQGVKADNNLSKDSEVENKVYLDPVCGSVKNMFINHIKSEKNGEYLENDIFEDAFCIVKNQQTVTSLDIVKVEPDSVVNHPFLQCIKKFQLLETKQKIKLEEKAKSAVKKYKKLNKERRKQGKLAKKFFLK